MNANPWDQREGETARAFEAFRTFRDLDPGARTIRAACEAKHGAKATPSRVKTWQQWHKRNDWSERARAYDAHLDALRQDNAGDAIEKMQQEHIESARLLRHFAMISLHRLIERAENDPDYVLPPGTVGTILREATTLERVSCGMPTAIERQVGDTGHQTVVIEWGDELPNEVDDDPNEGETQ